MKKGLLISVLILLCIGSGCASDGDFVPMEYSAEAGKVNAIILDVRDRRIDISPSSDGKIHIDYFTSDKEGYDINLSESGELSMKSTSNKGWMDFIGVKPSASKRVISMRLPSSVAFSLKAETTNESIAVNNLQSLKDASLSSNGGDIVFDNIGVEDSLTLYAQNGDVNGTLIGSYDDFSISYDVKKGKCNLPLKDGGEKLLDVTVNNGNVNIELV